MTVVLSMRNIFRTTIAPASAKITAGMPRILMYHRFGKDGEFRRLSARVFEEQLRFLKRTFHVVSLREIVAHIRNGASLPRNSLAITIDDGYVDFMDLAYPLLQKYEAPATLYVVAAFAEGDEWLWMDKLQYITSAAKLGRYPMRFCGSDRTLRICSDVERRAAWECLADRGLKMSVADRTELIHDVARSLSVELPRSPPPEFRSVTWTDLRSIDHDLIEVGCHSMTHPILSRCKPEEQKVEIVEAKALVEWRLGRTIQSYCYPNGQAQDFDENCLRLVASAGFSSAVVAYEGLVNKRTLPFEIPRIGAAMSLAELKQQLDGLSWCVSRLRQFGLR
jgi:peptidoglycan/xylan/chitin deacetylase (PgdA/CDA1 family)